MAKTAAEQQIDMLRRLKEGKGPRKAPSPAGMEPLGLLASAEAPRRSKPAKPAGLGVSAEVWKRLLARQRQQHAFKNRRQMGDWAAELLLALPPSLDQSPEQRAALLERLKAWSQGLRPEP